MGVGQAVGCAPCGTNGCHQWKGRSRSSLGTEGTGDFRFSPTGELPTKLDLVAPREPASSSSSNADGPHACVQDDEPNPSAPAVATGDSQQRCWLPFLAATAVVLPMNAVLLLLTSMLTDTGIWAYQGLARPHPQIAGGTLRACAFSAALACLACIYLLDLWRWRGRNRAVFVVVYYSALTVSVVGLLFLTPKAPVIPLVVGMICVIAATYFLKKLCFKSVTAQAYNRAVAGVFLLTALAEATVWSVWLWLPAGMMGYDAWSEEVEEELRGADPLVTQDSAFVLWCSPATLAIANAIIGAFVFMRSRFQARVQASENADRRLGIEVKLSISLLATVAFGCYVAASLGANDSTVSRFVLLFSAVTFLLLFLYLARWVGPARLKSLAKESDAAQAAASMLTSDWVKGTLLLLGHPLIVPFVAADLVRNFFQARLRRCGVLEPEPPEKGTSRWLTAEGGRWLDQARCFLLEDATSVLLKAMYCSIIINTTTVCVSTCIPLALVQVEAWMKPVPLVYCLLGVFFVVLGLFLIPPISGQIIYGFAATVVVPKFGYGSEFWTGVAASCGICLLGKLVGAVIEMKLIGVPGSRSVAVKKFIGIQTRFMKALRYVLARPGCSVGKAAILCFGPDWPTSVLTGILDLPVFPMLLGTLPVVVVIAPACISFAYLLKAAEVPEHAGTYQSIAGINLLLSGVIAAIGNGLIAFSVQKALAENREELDRPDSDWMRDPLEAHVLAAIDREADCKRKWDAKTRWDVLPRWVRAYCLSGLTLATASVYVLLQPVHKPFKKFGLGEDLSALDGGLSGIVNPAGWAVLGCTTLVTLLIVAFHLWGRLPPAGAVPTE